MTVARNQLISVSDTPYYHIISRCVRRAFLCGQDSSTNRSYEHRRQWIVDRIQFLSEIFSIDICAYAVLHNHYHLVLKVASTADWSDKQVLIQWKALCTLPSYCDRYLCGDKLKGFEVKLVTCSAALYRERLMSISWFMRFVNQHIAVAANKEDNCTGHFWESRFKSQALLDERALLTCMAYVDLNPIRAAMAKTPESSDFTSVQERITVKKTNLLAFGEEQNNIPYSLSDYLALVDYTGRAVLDNKRGFIPKELEPILLRLNLDPDCWFKEIQKFSSKGVTAIGTANQLKAFCLSVGKKWGTGGEPGTATS
jgi:REP element-mobilizing transposase RayT